MKVAVFSSKTWDEESLGHAGSQSPLRFSFLPSRLTRDTVHLAAGHEAVCLFVNDEADTRILHALSDLGIRIIALRCAGFNRVDLAAAEALHLSLVRVPEYSPQAVAEHALALILTLNRHTHRAWNRVREGNFDLTGLMGFDLGGKTVGIIGTGRIGRAFAHCLSGFGSRLLGMDPQENGEFAQQVGLQYTSLSTLLTESDVVSLHCPLTPETNHLINEHTLSKMKATSMLINTGRGALVDTPAVTQALKDQRLGSLGIDVYEEESELFFEDHSSEILQDDHLARLLTLPNVLVTGHQGFFTHEAIQSIAETTVNSLLALHSGSLPAPSCRIEA
ncbi:MAG: 2-hydroxyacid dehydrogenase [Verrucomicrobiota bacterium]